MLDPDSPFATLAVGPKVIFGPGAEDETGRAVKELGAERALIVSDPGVAAAGHADHAARSLAAAGIKVEVFAEAHENPTTKDAEACRDAARRFEPDAFVGVGGGSAIDTARAGNMLYTNGGRMEDYWGVGKVPGPMRPFVAVPTTTGTGSEMQSFALIMNDEGRKMACGDRKAASAVAILDPELATTQPKGVRACTGLDCIAHALESAVCTKRSVFSSVFSTEAWRLASSGFEHALAEPTNVEAQGVMMRAAAFAGLAIEHAMLGAAHALANPLTAAFGVTHGEAVGTTLPQVVRFNAHNDHARAIYTDLARIAGIESDPIEGLCAWLNTALQLADLPGTLSTHGVTADALDQLAEGAAKQWTGTFNPRQASHDDWKSLYSACL